MAINGMHTLLYTSEPEKLRAMLRDVFGFKHVDAGGGWLIFATPPSEMGVHPAEGPSWDAGTRHLISFMCDDIKKTMAALRAKGVDVGPNVSDEGYGITTTMHLPGGCDVMLYEPRHPVAIRLRETTEARARQNTPGRSVATAAKKAKKPAARRAKKAARRR
jgi:hypothetical protein